MASDHVIESFRNDMWPGYKSSVGMDPEILEQIPVMERALEAAGFVVWPMVEHEADDALAAAAALADADERVEQVLIVTADKDLGQCVSVDARGAVRPSQAEDHRRRRRAGEVRGRARVDPRLPRARRRHAPTDSPALPAGDPRAQHWCSPGTGHIEYIPASAGQWDVPGLRGAPKLSATLQANMAEALLFRRIATVETDLDVGTVDSWRWTGPTADFADVAEEIGPPTSCLRPAGSPTDPVVRPDPTTETDPVD